MHLPKGPQAHNASHAKRMTASPMTGREQNARPTAGEYDQEQAGGAGGRAEKQAWSVQEEAQQRGILGGVGPAVFCRAGHGVGDARCAAKAAGLVAPGQSTGVVVSEAQRKASASALAR